MDARVDRALFAVVTDGCLHGVSTCKLATLAPPAGSVGESGCVPSSRAARVAHLHELDDSSHRASREALIRQPVGAWQQIADVFNRLGAGRTATSSRLPRRSGTGAALSGLPLADAVHRRGHGLPLPPARDAGVGTARPLY
jgi:hypothetical protein